MTGARGYVDRWNPTSKNQVILDAARQVLVDYNSHLPMTVRQVFYVLVGRQVIEKTKNAYRNVAWLLNMARRAGVVPFEHIHDRGTTLPFSLLGDLSAEDLTSSLNYRVRLFELDPLAEQPRRVILWCEAAGMLSQLKRVGGRYGVKAIAGGGFELGQ